MRFDARGSLELGAMLCAALVILIGFLCALTREAPWNRENNEAFEWAWPNGFYAL